MRYSSECQDPEAIKGIHLFRGVDLDAILGVFDYCKTLALEAGDVLLTPGQFNAAVYFILSGRLRVHLDKPDGDVLAYLDAGDSAGEMSVIDRQPTTAYVVADTPSRLVAMDEEILWSLVQSSHPFACNLLFLMTKRLRNADALLSGGYALDRENRDYGQVDALTGFYNREWLQELLKRQIHRAERAGKPLSLVLLDVDSFAAYNGKYGRRCGDRLLYAVAYELKRQLRPSEIIARYTGDAFMVVLPDTDVDTGREVAVRLANALKHHSLPVALEGEILPFPTVSVGIASLKAGQDEEAIVADVEEALYRAKKIEGYSVSE